MAETNLIANIVPQFDASKMDEFVSSMADSISEALSSIDLPSFKVDIPVMPSVKVDTPDSIAVSAPESIALDYNADDFRQNKSEQGQSESILRSIMQDVASLASRKPTEERTNVPVQENARGDSTEGNGMDSLFDYFNAQPKETEQSNGMDSIFDYISQSRQTEERTESYTPSIPNESVSDTVSLPDTLSATLTSESVNDVVTSTVDAINGFPTSITTDDMAVQTTDTMGLVGNTVRGMLSELAELTISTLNIGKMEVGEYKSSEKPKEEQKKDVREDLTKREQQLVDKFGIETVDKSLEEVKELIAQRLQEDRENKSTFARIKESIFDFAMDKKTQLTSNLSLNKAVGGISTAMVAIPGIITAGIGAVTGIILGIFTLIKKSTPVLQDVTSLITDAFNMIWQPIGIIIAQQLTEVLPAIYERIGRWFSEAKDIYDKEGWAGLFKEAIVIAWTMFLEIATTAFAILWDGFQNVPVIGTIIEISFKIFDYLVTNLNSVVEVIKGYLATLVGLKTYEITSNATKDALGMIGWMPGWTLIGDAVGIAAGVGVGMGAYAVMDDLSEKAGLNEMISEVQDAYKEFKGTISEGKSSTYNNTLSSTVSTGGSKTYSSTGNTTNMGATYNNYWNISGADRDTLVNTIQNEVNKQVKVSRSYLGA